MKTPPHDLSRSILAVLAIGILIAATFWIMRPFLASIVWATMIVVATWPLMLAAQKRLWGRRYLAVALMTILLMLVLVIPLGLAIGTIVGNAEEIVGWARSLKDVRIPAPPEWVANLPMVGAKVAEIWQEVAAAGGAALATRVSPYAAGTAKWFVAQAGGLGVVTLEFLLTTLKLAFIKRFQYKLVFLIRRRRRSLYSPPLDLAHGSVVGMSYYPAMYTCAATKRIR